VKSISDGLMSLTHCHIGGTGTGFERAGHGLCCAGSSSVELRECRLAQCLNAFLATQNSTLRAEGSTVFNVSYGVGVDDAAQVEIIGSEFTGVRLGVLMAGEDTAAASLTARHCQMTGTLWFGRGRPGTLVLEENQVAEPPPRYSPLQESKDRKEYNFQPVDYLQRVGERPGSAFDFPRYFS